jgi:glycerol kinase
VAVSSEREATTRGAGLMALVAVDAITLGDVEALWNPKVVVAPLLSDAERQRSRDDWAEVVTRVEKTIPELSAVEF